MIELYF